MNGMVNHSATQGGRSIATGTEPNQTEMDWHNWFERALTGALENGIRLHRNSIKARRSVALRSVAGVLVESTE